MSKCKYTLYARSSCFREYESLGSFDTSREVGAYIVQNKLDVDNTLVMYGHKCNVKFVENGRHLYIEAGQQNNLAYSWPITSLQKRCPECGRLE